MAKERIVKADLREALGKALQECRRTCSGNWERPWAEKVEPAREIDRQCAEAVTRKYLEILVPGYLMRVRWDDGRKITEKEFYQLFGQERSAS